MPLNQPTNQPTKQGDIWLRSGSEPRAPGPSWNILPTIYIYIYIHGYKITHTHTHTHIYIYIWLLPNYIHTHLYIYMCVCACSWTIVLYIYTCLCVSVYVKCRILNSDFHLETTLILQFRFYVNFFFTPEIFTNMNSSIEFIQRFCNRIFFY